MCGIAGISFSDRASSVLTSALKSLEYRGYDSCGICVKNGKGLVVKKGIGDVGVVSKKEGFTSVEGFSGIAHTRWATHGGVTDFNAHPHLSCNNDFSLVHNGIIDNYLELKEELIEKGHFFRSQTDSEVIVHFLEEFCKNNDLLTSFKFVLQKIVGTYAFLAINSIDNSIVGAKNQSPLVIGKLKNGKGFFFASDILALKNDCEEVLFLDDEEFFFLSNSGQLSVFDKYHKPVIRDFLKIDFDFEDVFLGEFKSFMEKEIFEQQKVLPNALIQDNDSVIRFKKKLFESKKIFLVACGSSSYATLLFKEFLLSKGVLANWVLGSEFEKYVNFLDKDSLVFMVSQSGETADLITHVKGIKQRGAFLSCLVNVKMSTLDRVSDLSFYVNAGTEVGVATTKALTNQFMFLKFLSNELFDGNFLNFDKSLVGSVIDHNMLLVKHLAKDLVFKKSVFFLGRGKGFAVAKEGALKLKEISYLHAEGFEGGELKHGTLALIEKGVPVVCINPEGEEYSEMISNIHEVKARGGLIIGVSEKHSHLFDYWIRVPRSDFFEVLSVIPLQLLTLFTGYALGRNVDKPRNLAKSVTVR